MADNLKLSKRAVDAMPLADLEALFYSARYQSLSYVMRDYVRRALMARLDAVAK